MYTIIIKEHDIYLPNLTLDQLQAHIIVLCNADTWCYPTSASSLEKEFEVIAFCLQLLIPVFEDVKFEENIFTLAKPTNSSGK